MFSVEQSFFFLFKPRISINCRQLFYSTTTTKAVERQGRGIFSHAKLNLTTYTILHIEIMIMN